MLKNEKLYYIGGVVRDEFLGIKSFDTDYCYEGNAIDFAKKSELNIVKENPAFGTVKVILDNKEIDIASTRKESYPLKGHLPKVNCIGCPLKEDLIRRDFTINAMAKRTTDNAITDYYGGVEDIKNKTLKVLHKHSFIDDPTRILRGLKFSVRFNFNLSDETFALQEEYLKNINYDMSYHRLKKELQDSFNLNKAEVFDKFNEYGLYKLLGTNTKKSPLLGKTIQEAANTIKTEHIWLFYAAPFINEETLLPLTRSEKRIIEWVCRLKTQVPVNNTPKESIIIKELL